MKKLIAFLLLFSAIAFAAGETQFHNGVITTTLTATGTSNLVATNFTGGVLAEDGLTIAIGNPIGTSVLACQNTGGFLYVGLDGSTGSSFGNGDYAANIYSTANTPLCFATNSTTRMCLSASGVVSINNLGAGVVSSSSGGILTSGSLPNPSPSSLGGIESFAGVTGEAIGSISPAGVPSPVSIAAGTGTVTQVFGTSPIAVASPTVTPYITLGSIAGNSTISKAPTRQIFTSGTGATYTLPTSPSPLYIHVRMVGGGGGGGGNNGSSVTNGSAGGATSFGTSLLVANGGGGGTNPFGGTGGTASLGSGPTGFATQGSQGGSGDNTATAGNGGDGPGTPFGGGSPGGASGYSASNAIAYTGAGGGGSGGSATVASLGAGGAGGYVDAFIYSPSSTYTYTVGAGGAGGSSTYSGGNGSYGTIVVDEYYQ